MPDKLTDSEIKKALKSRMYKENKYMFSLLQETLDLINRLQARVDDLERNDLPRCKDALRRANEIGVELQAENENYRKNNQQMTSDILALYKELEQAKAENERLCAEVDELIISKDLLFDEAEALIKTAKAEAYKECIEKVKKKGVKVGVDEICIFEGTLNNILKELGGDDK